VPSTRLLAKRREQHVVHVYTRRTRGERGGRSRKECERRGKKRENPLAQITRLGLLFIVGNFCFHREASASDRRSKDDLCAERSQIERERERGGSTRRASTAQESQFKFLPASRESNAAATRQSRRDNNAHEREIDRSIKECSTNVTSPAPRALVRFLTFSDIQLPRHEISRAKPSRPQKRNKSLAPRCR